MMNEALCPICGAYWQHDIEACAREHGFKVNKDDLNRVPIFRDEAGGVSMIIDERTDLEIPPWFREHLDRKRYNVLNYGAVDDAL